MKKQMLFVAGLITVLTFSVTSVSWAGPIVKREKRQQKRIAQGVESGQLTPRETAKLERGEARIDRERQRMLSDGNLTAREKAKLTHDQNVMSRRIYRQKHDNQVRPGVTPAIPATPATPADPGVNPATPATPATPAQQ